MQEQHAGEENKENNNNNKEAKKEAAASRQHWPPEGLSGRPLDSSARGAQAPEAAQAFSLPLQLPDCIVPAPPCHRPALFAWIVGGGKNLTPVRRCGLSGPHPHTSRGWRRLCQRLGHTGVSKHAEMAAIAALSPECLARRRLTLVVMRLRQCGEGPRLGQLELGLARPCDECSKVICALGCFRRIVYSTDEGGLACSAPEELLEQSTPSTGKKMQEVKQAEACKGAPRADGGLWEVGRQHRPRRCR